MFKTNQNMLFLVLTKNVSTPIGRPTQWQGRIKVCGGPRLDTFTGPYPSFYLLSSPTRTEG